MAYKCKYQDKIQPALRSDSSINLFTCTLTNDRKTTIMEICTDYKGKDKAATGTCFWTYCTINIFQVFSGPIGENEETTSESMTGNKNFLLGNSVEVTNDLYKRFYAISYHYLTYLWRWVSYSILNKNKGYLMESTRF